MSKISLAGLVLCWLLLWCGAAAAEPAKGREIDLGGCDFVFVDATEDTGYYVDLNEQNFTSSTEVIARVEMVRASQKRLYLYTVYFNRRLKLYQVLKTEIADYDSKLLVGGSEISQRPVFYEAGTMMAVLADYIFNPY